MSLDVESIIGCPSETQANYVQPIVLVSSGVFGSVQNVKYYTSLFDHGDLNALEHRMLVKLNCERNGD